MVSYVFDVDGTLTPSRSVIDTEFATWFLDFCNTHDVCLVTGSDKAKTLEQIGEDIYNKCRRVYQCSGNEVYEGTSLLRTSEIELPSKLIELMEYWLRASQFGHRSGNHIEKRPGLINFSIVGRKCGTRARQAYVQWDKNVNERRKIADNLTEHFGDEFNFQVAGETGIDITRKGFGKEQIVKDFDSHLTIHFFGDMIVEGGNDFEVAVAIGSLPNGNVYHVKNWEDTWKILKEVA